MPIDPVPTTINDLIHYYDGGSPVQIADHSFSGALAIFERYGGSNTELRVALVPAVGTNGLILISPFVNSQGPPNGWTVTKDTLGAFNIYKDSTTGNLMLQVTYGFGQGGTLFQVCGLGYANPVS